VKKLARRGLARIPDRPTVRPENEWIYGAFLTLNQTRASTGFGGSGLALCDVTAYLDEWCVLDPVDRQETIELLLKMDRTYMDWVEAHGNDTGKHAKSQDRRKRR